VTHKTTGIVGIPVHHSAKNELTALYEKLQYSLQRLPATSTYRTGTEALVKERLDILKQTEDLEVIEKQIGLGQMEELILQAKSELQLVDILEEDKVWDLNGSLGNLWQLTLHQGNGKAIHERNKLTELVCNTFAFLMSEIGRVVFEISSVENRYQSLI
jgi:NADH dehydrogenase (ubiquinone) 1 alpha subcomplex subunit 5